MINQEQIHDIVNRIVADYQPEKILLFGSYANGTATENSDLDLIVVKNTETPHHLRAYDVIKHLRGILIPVDIVVYTPDEIDSNKNEKFTFINEALKSIITLYDIKGKG